MVSKIISLKKTAWVNGSKDSDFCPAYDFIYAMDEDLVALYESQKQFPIRPVWRQRDANNLQCIQALDIDGVTVEGLIFRATALLNRPDENVTFQIEYVPPRKQQRGGPLSRVEWRPLSAHNNKQIGPKNLRNFLQTGSHHHDFHECWKVNPDNVRKGKLQVAIPIHPEPSWAEILVFVGKEFRIEQIDWVPFPPWKPVIV